MRQFPSAPLLLLLASRLAAQRSTGELRILVQDPSGGVMTAHGQLVNQSADFHLTFDTDSSGRYVARRLPFGRYRLDISRDGFLPTTELLEVSTEVPTERSVTLQLASSKTAVLVLDAATLLDPSRSGSIQYIGKDFLETRRSSLPGRALLDQVDSQPGWLLEANGVLHPRGSEYQVQYVVDGVPLLDNRSPGFAPPLDIEDVEAMNVRTGGYAAEYGRKLGGVVEVSTERDARQGFHGKLASQFGSFDTASGMAALQYAKGPDFFSVSGQGFHTARYLDPPVEANFTNKASGNGVAARYEREISTKDRLRFSFQRQESGFLVPNELLQQQAGQRQDRTSGESLGMVSYQRVLSPQWLLDARGMGRELSALLWSNPLSTPIVPFQDRGFRELYANASLSAHYSRHDVKFGAELSGSAVHEDFRYHIATYRVLGVRIFDRDFPQDYRFTAARDGREQGLFIQDRIRWRNLTLSLGLRYDHYQLVANEHAVSPRIGLAYSIPSWGLSFRASYDRAFQTPATENVLFSSLADVAKLGNQGLALPLRPSRGNFYEAGFSKSLLSRLRLDGTFFRRDARNFADDSLLLNTGVTFPIAFDHARIQGVEAKVEARNLGPVSGFLSYSNLHGVGQLPIAGGPFLDDTAASQLASNERFPITQDQRNTVRGRVRLEATKRAWIALGARYGSGLPVELEGVTNANLLRQQYGARILDRVNFSRDRVRPNFTTDLTLGATLWKREGFLLSAQADVLNLADRLNVINFAGLLSGTAIDPGRSAAGRLRFEW